jgi:hypothetical protein
MVTLATGRPIIDVITLAYRSNIPLLLQGLHGVGKSEIAVQAATVLGIGVLALDLSVLEPPDLIGLPIVHECRTSYAAPSFLPTEGNGLLVFEELNRCSRHMRAPCLQLLTTRRLNDYALPPGWLPCACVNEGDSYHLDELDPALLSRFVQVRIRADVSAWSTWARVNEIHPRIIEFVEHSPHIFDDPTSNPRAWTYASRLLTEWERSHGTQELLVTVLSGVVGEHWAGAFLQLYLGGDRALLPNEVLDEYPLHRPGVLRWRRTGRLDLIAATLEQVQRHLLSSPDVVTCPSESVAVTNIQQFTDDLPPDLRRLARQWLSDRGMVVTLAS